MATEIEKLSKVKEAKEVDVNKDTAFFNIVNAHAESAKKIRIAEERVHKLHEEEELRKKAEIQAQKEKRVNMILAILKWVSLSICILFLAWVVISWGNVVMHNTEPNGYELIWNWNFFKVFFP